MFPHPAQKQPLRTYSRRGKSGRPELLPALRANWPPKKPRYRDPEIRHRQHAEEEDNEPELAARSDGEYQAEEEATEGMLRSSFRRLKLL